MGAGLAPANENDDNAIEWQRRLLGRSLLDAQRRSLDRGARLVRAAATVLERSNGETLTVQDVADEAGQSLRTLYQYFSSKDDLLLAVYEEATRTYAALLRSAISPLEDPIDRLAGAILASMRLPALHPHRVGVDRGLTRVRLQLSQADPELVARAQRPVTVLFHNLLSDVLNDGSASFIGVDQATYLVSSVRSALILSMTLGNDYGVELPDAVELSLFCLNGLGLSRPKEWHQAVDDALDLSGDDGLTILRRLAHEQPIAPK